MAELKKDMTLQELQKIIPGASALKVVYALLDKGLVSIYENLNERYKPRKESFIFLNETYSGENALKELLERFEKKPEYQDILLNFLYLRDKKPAVLREELQSRSGATAYRMKYLLDQGILQVRKMDTDRIRVDPVTQLQPIELNLHQEKAYEHIRQGFAKRKPVLLHGITGSGKTHIYFKLIHDCIEKGKQALYLLPEIALTSQIVRKLRSTFGDRVGIYHSRFSNLERVELWRKIRSGQFDVVVGARSALFLPFHKLGLIVLDEEHDSSYKQQDPSPRYQARDAAIYLASLYNADILLGTATPSIESYYNCMREKFELVDLHYRYGEGVLPVLQLVDLRNELAQKKMVKGIFSSVLINAIKQSLEQSKQVILFQNRRGYAPFLQCDVCAWVPQCKNCDVSLTYHKTTDQLHCHYCNNRVPLIRSCPACGNNSMKAKSFGTEKIEEEVKSIFPNARVERFDWDALRIKNKYADTIQRFEKREIDILVGTQILVKGLDFEHVDLVGVLSADKLMSYPDFRVNERAYQLLEQVSGRAGRTNDRGRVIIQLYQPNHPLLHFLKEHNYKGFFESEIQSRTEFLYPPVIRMIRITLRHKQEEVVANAATYFFAQIKDLPSSHFFGPAEPSVGRIKTYYIREILIKTQQGSAHLSEIKKILREKMQLLRATGQYTTVHINADVDP